MPEPTNRLKGVLCMVGAGLCWSTGGILIRSVTLTDAWEIVFWRAVFLTAFIGLFLTVRYRRRFIMQVTAVGLPGVVAGALLASTSFLFIASVMRTTVANALVLMSTTPFMTALLARLFLGEQVPWRTALAMTAGLAGIALMFADALGSGALIGNLLACGVPVVFAANVILLRHKGATADMMPTVLLTGLIALIVALPFGWPFTASSHDVSVLAVMGVCQLGFGFLFFMSAIPHLSAAEIGLLSLLETIFGPVWVWLGTGERPSDIALVGGGIVVTSLLVNEIAAMQGVRAAASAFGQRRRLPAAGSQSG